MEEKRGRRGEAAPLVLVSLPLPPTSDICASGPGRMHDSSGEPQLSRSPSFMSNSFEGKQAPQRWDGSLPRGPGMAVVSKAS